MTVSWSKVCGLVSLTMLLAAPAWAGKEDDTLNIAWREELPTYDAYYASPRESVLLARLVWDNLVDRDPVTFEYKPLLAESYEWIDEKTLEFRLRKGITFHNGEPFDADDVVYTLNRVSSPEAAVVNPKMVNWLGSAEDRQSDVTGKRGDIRIDLGVRG